MTFRLQMSETDWIVSLFLSCFDSDGWKGAWEVSDNYRKGYLRQCLNVALFGKTANQWRDTNPDKKGNIRDDANLNQLLVLANLESYNAILIGQGKTMSERLVLLRELAIRQMKTLVAVSMDGLEQLPGGNLK